jgi:hypothetical protein
MSVMTDWIEDTIERVEEHANGNYERGGAAPGR